MTTEDPTKEKLVHRYLGGSIVLKPAVSFRGKSGDQVDLPARIVVQEEGKSLELTPLAVAELVKISQPGTDTSRWLEVALKVYEYDQVH